MSEDQLNQPNVEQPQTETVSEETTETPSVTSENTTQAESTTEKSSVAKPNFWQQILGVVRSLLPQSLSQKFSDGLLTGAIAGIVALILVVIFVSVSASKPTTEVAISPVISEFEITEEIAVEDSLIPTIDAEDIEISDSTLSETDELIELTTTPPPELTPEQIFLVSIQNKIDDFANQYGEEIIESLTINLPSNLLIVEINNNWYNFTAVAQDNIVNQMFEEAEDLEFEKLALINSQGRTVARTSAISSK
ncbi:MAG: hypothetical protein AB4080_07850, partial [Trichodesmium sp.]